MGSNDYMLIFKDKSTDVEPLASFENGIIPQINSNVMFKAEAEIIRGKALMVKYDYDLQEVTVLIHQY